MPRPKRTGTFGESLTTLMPSFIGSQQIWTSKAVLFDDAGVISINWVLACERLEIVTQIPFRP
jgi:hypothetical protein